MLLSHRNQTPFHIIDYLFHVLPDVKVFPVSSVLHFFPHSSSSLITSESILFFPSLPPFPKVSLFTPLSQVLSTQVIFFFPRNKFGCAFSFFSPNNFLLFALASHNECCVKVCTFFFPTT